MIDHVLCLDGPLAGRQFVVEETAPAVIGFEALVDTEQRVLAVNNERPPTYQETQSVVFVYTATLAFDGLHSRDDDGCVRVAYSRTQDAPV